MKNLDFTTISRKIKAIRLEKGLTQETVASFAGVNTSHISNIENGRVKVSLTTLVAICNALDITVDYILSDEYNNSSSALDHSILEALKECDDLTKERLLKIIQILK